MEISFCTLLIMKSRIENEYFIMIEKKGIKGSMLSLKLHGVCPFLVYLQPPPSAEI
jgi:hypothetical protein